MHRTIVCAALFMALIGAAHAQDRPSIFGVLRDIANAAAQQPAAGGAPTDAGASVLGHDGSAPSEQATLTHLMFKTKQDFNNAARDGKFAGYHRTSSNPDDQTMAVMNAVAYVLEHEYRTPVPNWNERNRSAGGNSNNHCMVSAVKTQMHQIMQIATEAKVQLYVNRPPDFTNDRAADKRPQINSALRDLKNMCYQTVDGQDKPYPFIDSYIALMREYAAATGQYVEQRQAEAKEKYQRELAAKRAEDAQQADAAQRAQHIRREQEQKQIDAERRRIEAQEQKAKERQRNRVAG